MPYTYFNSDELIEAGFDVLTSSFSETLHFLIAAIIVLAGALFVGNLLIKIVDRDAEPFLAFKFGDLQALPLIATSFVVFAVLVQVLGSVAGFFLAEGDVPLANIALTNMVATIGMEAAFLVVLGGCTVISLAWAGAVTGKVDEAVRSRSRGGRKE